MRTRWNIDKQVFINGEPKMNWWSRDCLRNMFYDRKMFILRKSIWFFITFGLSGLFLLSLFISLGLWHLLHVLLFGTRKHVKQENFANGLYLSNDICCIMWRSSSGYLLLYFSLWLQRGTCLSLLIRNAICTVWVLMRWLHWCFFKTFPRFFLISWDKFWLKFFKEHL